MKSCVSTFPPLPLWSGHVIGWSERRGRVASRSCAVAEARCSPVSFVDECAALWSCVGFVDEFPPCPFVDKCAASRSCAVAEARQLQGGYQCRSVTNGELRATGASVVAAACSGSLPMERRGAICNGGSGLRLVMHGGAAVAGGRDDTWA
ncbi:fibrillin-2 [Sesbania bispinosa]|nr:fibrillin-2 [Sesbania bispinosa]